MITGVLAGTLTNPSSILNSNLKPEIATSYEVGF
jgi:outer membrane receptor protein involved in Fe transport